MRYLRLFLGMRPQLRWILIKTTIYSLWAEIFVLTHRDYLLRRSTRNYPEASSHSADELQVIRDVRKASKIIGKRAPWNPMCLNLAYVGKKILHEYNIESTFRLGYLQGKPKNQMEGHAWITVDSKLVTGWLANLDEYVEMTKP